MKLVHSLHTGIDRESGIGDLKFSQDGKYLVVGFWETGMTNVYDVQTGKKTWLVFHVFFVLGYVHQLLSQYTERCH